MKAPLVLNFVEGRAAPTTPWFDGLTTEQVADSAEKDE
jgi:hypothetical protein